ncbi:MAG: thioester reductase domain-containing protein [Caldilineaceae bacterium]|nr:thioester reductase domain-containing protein [Caldilineaceae bacterium]
MMTELQIDAQLDPTIQFPSPVTPDVTVPKAILLTGATGFLGAYLLAELLRHTTADLYCLLRAESPAAGKARLRDHLQFYQLWDDTFAARMVPILGDLAQPRLGLADAEWQSLADRIDVIYHNGAQVNAVYPYARLKAANVDGTVTLLQLAGLHHTKPLHFVSSLAIFMSRAYVNQTIRESDFPAWESNLQGGYRQSKWVAEALIREAQRRGLPGGIYRPGIIMEHSQSAIQGKPNNVSMGIEACLQLGAYPQLKTTTNFAPVDYVSQAIVYLSQQSVEAGTPSGRIFHLCNPASVAWPELFAMLQRLDHPVVERSYADWLKELELQTQQQPENKTLSVIRFLMRLPLNLFTDGPCFLTQETQAALATSSISCPKIDEQLLATYFHP